MKNRVTISPSKTIEVETANGSTIQEIMDVYETLTGVQISGKHSIQLNGRPAVLDDTVKDGDRIIATENKQGASEEVIDLVEDKEIIEETGDTVILIEEESRKRVLECMETAKNFIKDQVERYEKSPLRQNLVKPVAEFVNQIILTDKEIADILANVSPAKRNLKWNKEALEETDSKTYALAELKDKAETVTDGSLNQVVYLTLAEIISKSFVCEIKLAACFHPACRSIEFLETVEIDGNYVTRCANPKHKTFPIAAPAGETVEQSRLNWNAMIKG